MAEDTDGAQECISIQPGVSVLAVLRHLNYKPWFALAEFVDNSIESFARSKAELTSTEHTPYVQVAIETTSDDGGKISIRDNAAGISGLEFPRAFRPAEIPPDRNGLSEFGMGMKSAACWFAPRWDVRTSAIGEPVERLVEFDIGRIVRDELRELRVNTTPAPPDAHFTELTLRGLHRVPAGRTLGKIREHLADIYRVFLRSGTLRLTVNGEEVVHDHPEILTAPATSADGEETGPQLEWRSEIDLNFGDGLRVSGFAALRKQASTTHAGFSLFRRNRLIVGSADEKYRPKLIFGAPNSFTYQRLFGELHLEGFEVSHTKDGFRWDENEEPFIELLKEHLDSPPTPLLRQAKHYRTNRNSKESDDAAYAATEGASKALSNFGATALEKAAATPEAHDPPRELPSASKIDKRVVDIDFADRRWRVVLEVSQDPAVGSWLEVSESVLKGIDDAGRELLGLRMALMHPFMQRHAGSDFGNVDAMFRLAVAIGLAEKLARDGGVREAGAVRRKMNRLLREVLSRG
ncbi:MAG: hypothetical protein DHS20C15_33490 [Planctomycetota bacterium]|nr:MAG: hypothetical protein DHS20C15_33490 [Planctomycetota bacterium]